MPFYSDDVLEEVRRGNDIVEVVSSYVQLRQRGSSYWGLCPFHREKSPSFSVSPNMQIFHCFGCGVGGNVISFIMRMENFTFPDAVKRLAERARITLPESMGNADGERVKLREAIYDVNAKAARFYFSNLAQSATAREYLAKRRIKHSTAQKFGLGYASDKWDELYKHMREQGIDDSMLEKSGLVTASKNGLIDKFRGRLMFPIMDANERVCGFGGRAFGENNPKYLNSPDTPVFSKNRSLFALNFARKTRTNRVIMVEGYMDALSLYQHGFTDVVATLGTATGREHARALNQYFRGRTVILLFDSDNAGEAAVLRAIPILRRENIQLLVLRLSGAKDPDEFLARYGSDAFADALDGALAPTDFQLGLIKRNADKGSSGRISWVNSAVQVLAQLTDPIERDVYINAVAKDAGISAEAIKERTEAAAGGMELPGLGTALPLASPRVRSGFDPGLMRDYCNVLYQMSAHIILYESIRDALSPDEILFPAYKRLYHEIRQRRDAKGVVNPADLLSAFDDPADQQSVSAVFANPMKYTDDNVLKSALNQELRRIKEAYIKRRIAEAGANNDPESVKTLINSRKNLLSQYI